MFEKIISDFKTNAATTVQLTSLAALAGVTLLVAFVFLCAAGFIYIHQNYGPIEACFAGAALFFFLTVLIGGYYMGQRSEVARKAELARLAAKEKTKDRTLLQTALSDPLVLATGLQMIRAVGIKRLLPVLAVGGVALGLWANRRDNADDHDTPPAEH
jgi:hypothetical protein